MIVFKATNEHFTTLLNNIFDASVPMGMGFYSFSPHHKLPTDYINKSYQEGVSMDYVAGRMIKTHIERIDDGVFCFPNTVGNIEYQSWLGKFDSYEDLLIRSGIKFSHCKPSEKSFFKRGKLEII